MGQHNQAYLSGCAILIALAALPAVRLWIKAAGSEGYYGLSQALMLLLLAWGLGLLLAYLGKRRREQPFWLNWTALLLNGLPLGLLLISWVFLKY